MAINIQNIIDAVQAKLQEVSSSTTSTENIKLTNFINYLNTSGGVTEYRSMSEVPMADSSSIGKIIYTQDIGVDGQGEFYLGSSTAWNRIVLNTDVAEELVLTQILGTTYGYSTAGSTSTVIDKFPYASNGNAVAVGNLEISEASTMLTTGYSSLTSGYASRYQYIHRFPFAADGDAVLAGEKRTFCNWEAGVSSTYDGYICGGSTPAVYSVTPVTNKTQRFPFTSDTPIAERDGNLTHTNSDYMLGLSSTTYGYVAGGLPTNATNSKLIQKFPFANAWVTAVNVGNLSTTRYNGAGTSSATHGYSSGGANPPTTNIIEKWPFVSDGNATDVGDLTIARYGVWGHSGYDNNYVCGLGPSSNLISINKFSVVSDGNATSVGSLSIGRERASAQQY